MDLDKKNFSPADQDRFARMSGDYNPIHLDPIIARRTQMGAPIVHGVNAVLWALEALCRGAEISVRNLQVNFLEPIYLGETAIVTLARRSETQVRLNIEVEGAVATAITLGRGSARKLASKTIADGAHTADWPRFPAELELDAMNAQLGVLPIISASGWTATF